MLQELNIQNLALIESLQLQFETGFTSLTGETGAGKSILLDALGLSLGERADTSLVRHNTPRADVTASFDIHELPFVQQWLVEQELDDSGDCYLRRTVTSEGRSKAYINGRPVPVSQLKTLGNFLIDIHGQHEHQSLLSNNKQLDLLDAYAKHKPLLEATRSAYQAWQKSKQRLEQSKADQSDFQSKLELLSFQSDEFAQINPVEGEFEQLSEEQSQLSHASEIKMACLNAYEALDGDEGASSLIQSAIQQLEDIVQVCPAMESNLAQLNGALIEIQEAANEVQHQANHTELDPAQLNEIEERLSQLFGLAKKYNLTPEELVDKQQQLQAALDELTASDVSIEQLEAELESAWQAYQKVAGELTASRQQAANALEQVVTEGMQVLGMPNGIFDIAIQNADSASAKGMDKVTFNVTANKGQPLQPLAKVASGGELSRISLAIQVATAEVASLPTLIFDEVDVGIGGGTAEVVGRKMQELGRHKQILSITHLAQVASHGNQHLRIQKHTNNDLTFTEVVALDNAERIEELARMAGGLNVTEQTRALAQEMLQNAQA